MFKLIVLNLLYYEHWPDKQKYFYVYFFCGLQEMIVKIIDVKHSPPWDEIGIMKELDHPSIVKVTLLCFLFSCIAGNIRDRICDCLSFKRKIIKILLVKTQIRLPASPWAQDINWSYIRRSEDVGGVFWMCSVCRVYFVLCPGDLHQSKAITMIDMISIKSYTSS